MYIPGHLKSNQLPTTIGKVKTWNRQANYTDDFKLRDVRPLMAFLKRLPQADRYLFGLFQTRKLAILGFEHTIAFPEEFQVSENDERRLNELKTRFRLSKIQDLGEDIINGRLFGMSCVRLIWDNTPGLGTHVTKKQRYDLTELDIDLESDGLVYIETDTNGVPTRKQFENPEQLIQIRYNPFTGIDQYYVGGIARINMIYVLLKYWDFHNWSKNNEKYSDPMIYAQYRQGTDKKKEIPTILAGLAKLGTDSYAAFSDQVQIKLLEAQRYSTAQAHQSLIDQINKEMAISVLGQQLTTEVGKIGSFAAAKVANYVRQDYLYADMIAVADGFNQYIRKDWELNYGKAAVYPEYKWKLDEREDYEANARVIAELMTARESADSLPLKRSEVYEKTGFTIPEDGDDVI